jgi:hypothetical protein
MHKARSFQQILQILVKHKVLYKCEQVRQNLLVNGLEKTIVMFSCKINLQLLAPLVGFTLTDIQISTEVFPPTIYNSRTHCVQLAFSYRPINIHRPMRLYQPYGTRGCKTGCQCFPNYCLCADFETAIHNAVTTVWPGLEVKACRFHLGQSRAILGTQQAVWKERL